MQTCRHVTQRPPQHAVVFHAARDQGQRVLRSQRRRHDHDLRLALDARPARLSAWCALQDLNPRPRDYESPALTN